MTLAHMIDTQASDWKRLQYASETPLGELRVELDAQLRAYDTAWLANHTPWSISGLGFEGWSGVYRWTQAYTRGQDADSPRLTDATKLEDVGYRWIAVYPVTGSSGVHYVHVDLIQQSTGPHKNGERRIPVFLTKTFAGHEAAVQIAAYTCRLLGV